MKSPRTVVVLAFLVILTFLVAAAGCSSDDPTATPTRPASSPRSASIVSVFCVVATAAPSHPDSARDVRKWSVAEHTTPPPTGGSQQSVKVHVDS